MPPDSPAQIMPDMAALAMTNATDRTMQAVFILRRRKSCGKWGNNSFPEMR